MSYNNPTPISMSGAIGIDGSIAGLQSALASEFPWMTVFHRAYPFRERSPGSGKEITVPKVWEGKNEYRNVLPNDFLKGQAFFVVQDEESVKQYSPHEQVSSEVLVSLIIWVNTSQIPGHMTGPSLGSFKAAVLSTLGETDGVLSIDSFVDQDAEEVFKGYSVDDCDTQYLMLPYAGLRVNFKMKGEYIIC